MGLFIFYVLLAMQIFVKALSGTRTLHVEESDCVEQLKQRIEVLEGIPSDLQRLSISTSTLIDGSTLSEFGVENLSVIELNLGLEGGRKKKKKKTYTKPKKIKKKPKKVKLAVLKYYKVIQELIKLKDSREN